MEWLWFIFAALVLIIGSLFAYAHWVKPKND